MDKILWHNLPEKEAFELLKTSKKGLTQKIAEKRLRKYGPNKLPESKKAPWFFILFSQFKSPLIYILLIAAVVTFFLKEYVDMWVILAAVLINTLVGFVQENKAEKTLAYLHEIVKYKAKVFRDGKEIIIDPSELTIGDVVLVETGDRIPADGRLFESSDLQVNEAALTGESLPVNKELGVLDKGTNVAERANFVFMGTSATRGRGKFIVTDVGLKTHIGEIASLLKETKEEDTPLQLKLSSFSKKLGILVLVLCLFIFGVGIILGHEVLEMFETAVALAVAAIPEGLLVSVTIILTVGMQRILKQKALVRRLVAAETLGSTSVICTDKTGTLTEGKMMAAYLLTGQCDLKNDLVNFGDKKINNNNLPDHYLLLTIGAVCNNAISSNHEKGFKEDFIGDPTEIALLKASIESGLDYERLREKFSRLDEIPFSTEIKFMATLNKKDEENNVIYLKGAPERVLDFCSSVLINGKEEKITKENKKKILENFNKLTSQGLRVLAVAYKTAEKDKGELKDDDLHDFVFVGVFALKDPLRKEAKVAIHLCKQAGIHPVIITGDHRLTVKAIAKEIGLDAKDENIIEGSELDDLSDDELKEKVKEVTIYARALPKHKLRIVDAWQANGEVVAMLGDGVNDAPALKTSDIGVALGSGTDVAKEASDIILLDDNFKTIVGAVKQGRIVFDNIRKVIVFLLANTFSEMVLILGALAFGLPLPITALQILYINIIADGFPNVALAFEPGEEDIMKQKVKKKDRSILNQEMKVIIFIIGILTDLIIFGLFIYLLGVVGDLRHIQTLIFTVLAVTALMYVFSCKSFRKSIWQINIFSNKYLNIAILLGLGCQLFALYVPFMRDVLNLTFLTWGDWIIILVIASIRMFAIEATKYVYILKEKREFD
ncbi:MAG TPA: HAD family hydrolase [Candidatus Uhrbacteria bacterium]|nr:HAD family hydrolase [Candidatus Uhrbacteria bacterium]